MTASQRTVRVAKKSNLVVLVEAFKCVLGLKATVRNVEKVQVFQCQH